MEHEQERVERSDCAEREEHGKDTEPRFEIKLPKPSAGDVYGSLLEGD